MMPGWNPIRQPSPQLPMNRNQPMMGGGNMMMGGYGMNQGYPMGGGQMMYQQPYMQQQMYSQPMMMSNMGSHPQMNQQPLPSHAPLPVNAPNQPPPPAPCEPPPNSSAPLPPVEEKKLSSQPPPPDSAKEWWKSELESLSGPSRQELLGLTKTDWFLDMTTNQQIEYWQHKIQIKSMQGQGDSNQNIGVKQMSSFNNPTASSTSQNQIPKNDSISDVTKSSDQDIAPEWDKSSGENPHEALERYRGQLTKLKEQAEVFEKQYSDWRKQFDEWKEKHRNHPNKTQFNQYEKQWVTWQKQMLEQKNQNEANKEKLLESVKKIEQTIEDEKKQKEEAEKTKLQQNASQSFYNQGSNSSSMGSQYQQANQNVTAHYNYSQAQFQSSAANRPAMWGSTSNQYQQPGPYNPYSMGPQFNYNQPRPSHPPYMAGDGQSSNHFQNRAGSNESWPRMPPSNQSTTPNYSQTQPPMPGNSFNSNTSMNDKQSTAQHQRNEYDAQGNAIPSQNPSQQSSNFNDNNQELYSGDNVNDSKTHTQFHDSSYQQKSNFYSETHQQAPFSSNVHSDKSGHLSELKQNQEFSNSQLTSENANIHGYEGKFSDNSYSKPMMGSENNQPRPRFSGDGQQFSGDSLQRPRFLGDNLPRSQNLGNAEAGQRFPRDAGFRPRFPGDSGARNRFPDNNGPRQRFPGDGGPRQRFPGDTGPRQRFPGDTGPRQRFPGDTGPRQRFPGNTGPRQRFPGGTGPRQRFPGDRGPREGFSNENDGPRSRFSGDNSSRPRFFNDSGFRPRFPGDAGSRQRFLGDNELRHTFSGSKPTDEQFAGKNTDAESEKYFSSNSDQSNPVRPGDKDESKFKFSDNSRPRFPGGVGERSRFPGDTRPRFSRDTGPRQRFSGDAGPRRRFPSDRGPRQRFPGDAGSRQRFPGDTGSRQRFPGDTGPRKRFPDDRGPRQRFSSDTGPRQRFTGDAGPRQRYPSDSGLRPRFLGDSRPRPRFPTDKVQRPSFPADSPKDIEPNLSPGKVSLLASVRKSDEEKQLNKSDSKTNEKIATKPDNRTEKPKSDIDYSKDEDYHVWDKAEKINASKPPMLDKDLPFDNTRQYKGPRFPVKGPPPSHDVKVNQFGDNFVVIEDDFDSDPPPDKPQFAARPRFPQHPPIRRPQGKFESRFSHPRFENQPRPRHFGDHPRPRWSENRAGYDDRAPYRDRPERGDGPVHGNIDIDDARKLAESNPLFSEDNMKKLQEQLKLITQQNKNQAKGQDSKDPETDASGKHMDRGKILEKASNLSCSDLKSILAAVKITSSSKPPDIGRGRGSDRYGENVRPGDRKDFSRAPDGKQNLEHPHPKVDPLLNSLEALAAAGALDDDDLLQKYLRDDPLLKEEIYNRAMHDENLLMEARRVGGRHDRERSNQGVPFPRRKEKEFPEPARYDGRKRGSFDGRPDSPPLRDFVYPPQDDDRRRSDGLLFKDPHHHPRDDGFRGKSPLRDLRDAGQRDLERRSIERRHQAINRDLLAVKEERENLDNVFVYDEREEERMRRERSLERLRASEADLHEREQEILERERMLRDALRQFSPTRKRPYDDDRRGRGPPDSMRRGPRHEMGGPPDGMRRGPSDDTRRGPIGTMRGPPHDGPRREYDEMRGGPPDSRRRPIDERKLPPHDRFGNAGPGRGRGSPGREFGGDRFRPGEHFGSRDREFRDERDRPRRRSLSPRRDDMRRREGMDKNRLSSPRRRSPPRKMQRSRSPARIPKDDFGRDHKFRGRSHPDHVASPRHHERSPRQDQKPNPEKPGPDRQNKPDPDFSSGPFADLQEPPDLPEIVVPPSPLLLNIEDLINMPGRLKRPPKIVVILRGLPGSGKTHIAKMIRDKENTFKVSPRMLSLDDYFMAEVEKSVKDPDSGKSTKKRVLEYEYEEEMEESYRGNLVRSLKKTLEDGYFTFVIMDAVNNKVEYFEDCYNTSKALGFEVYVAEISADVHECARRNKHGRKLEEIQALQKGWEKTPLLMNRVDVRQLLQESSIQDVEMGDVTDNEDEAPKKVEEEEDVSAPSSQEGVPKSKWETESAAAHLDKLDGIHKKKNVKQSMDDFLSVTDDYNARKSAPGKKRVRWADINERQNQQRMRDVGFVVGQTDWSRMMDDSHATQALNRTKFI